MTQKSFRIKLNYLEGITHNTLIICKTKMALNTIETNRNVLTIMEQTWKDSFRITEEDENDFDTRHPEHIEAYVRIQQHITKPYNRFH